MLKLRSTLTGIEYPFERLGESAVNGEALEVEVPGICSARLRPGRHLCERFADFLPLSWGDGSCSLGEGNTPLLPANQSLRNFTAVESLLLKDETQNPTWSFKDRGSLACILMAKEMGEAVTATISTGNMGNSIAAYAARAGMRSIVFIPHSTPRQKIQAMAMHGARIIRVSAPDYTAMKNAVLGLAKEFGLRIVSGNGPVRVEGYKLTAFELFEQMNGQTPDYIAVPTSACGHVRGIWKGWRELKVAGLVERLPKMIIVQAANNSPIVTAMRRGLKQVVPFENFQTIAEAITSGNPSGGDELLDKANRHGWLGEDVTEDEILEAQRQLAQAGHFVEPSSATSLPAIRKLRSAGKILPEETVVMMLTGAGLKGMDAMSRHKFDVAEANLDSIHGALGEALKGLYL